MTEEIKIKQKYFKQLKLITYLMNYKKLFDLKMVKSGDNLSFPRKGNTVRVHYEAFLTKTGVKFDSSRDRNETFEFVVGSNQVIQGWEEVIKIMSLGQIVRFTLSPEYAYDKEGLPGIIPPDSSLQFEIELISYE